MNQPQYTLPGGRSPSAISHIYMDYEKQMQFEHRLASHNSASKNIGQVSDGDEASAVPLKKEKEIKVYTKTP